MPRFTPKETPEMYVETLSTGLVFVRQFDLRGHMPRFTP